MPIKFLNAIKKPIQKTIKIAGITLVMLMMAYGIELTNDTAVSLAADYYYVDVSIEQEHPNYIVVTENENRPEVWVNEGGKLKAKVVDFNGAKDQTNLIKYIGNYYYMRYATNAFVRDGDLRAGGDYVYFCGMDCGRISGIGTLHGKNVMFCPDWNNNYGHLMEKGEVYNGVTLQTTGRLFFGRDSELTDECLQQLAAAGVDISNPTKLTTRLYSRESKKMLHYYNDEVIPADHKITRELYYKKHADAENISYYDIDYPASVNADVGGSNYYTDEIISIDYDGDMVDSQDEETKHGVYAEEGYRCDDADWLRLDWDGYIPMEPDLRKNANIADRMYWAYGIKYAGGNNK